MAFNIIKEKTTPGLLKTLSNMYEKPSAMNKVYLADNKTLEIEGKGDVSIQTPAGNQWTLQDVRYILGLKKNLISIGQLDSTGCCAWL